MLILAYLIGLLGSALLSFVVYLLNGRLDVQLHSFTLRFIFPIGGFFVGLVAANCIAWGKKIFQKKMVKIDILIALIFGLFSYLFIDYLSYYTMYINEDSNGEIDVVTSLSGKKGYDKISDYITFLDYMDMMNSSSSIQFRYRGALKVGDPIEMGRTGTLIYFFVQIIGVLIGAIVTMSRKRKESRYCDNCKKYKKTKVLRTIDPQSINEEELSTKLKQIFEYRGNLTKLRGLIDNFKDTDSNLYKQGERYFTLILVYCEECHQGDMILAHYVVGKDGSNLESTFPIELVGDVTPLLDESGRYRLEYRYEKEQKEEKSTTKKSKNTIKVKEKVKSSDKKN